MKRRLRQVKPNPTIEGRASPCRSEGIAFVVGLGGYRPSISRRRHHGDQRRRLVDHIHGGTGGGKRMAKAGLQIVAIPTTAGTGTEADLFTVITNGEEKIGGGGEKPPRFPFDPDSDVGPPH